MLMPLVSIESKLCSEMLKLPVEKKLVRALLFNVISNRKFLKAFEEMNLSILAYCGVRINKWMVFGYHPRLTFSEQ